MPFLGLRQNPFPSKRDLNILFSAFFKDRSRSKTATADAAAQDEYQPQGGGGYSVLLLLPDEDDDNVDSNIGNSSK
jgi:hypothetical protein